jgi:hypothetical protein
VTDQNAQNYGFCTACTANSQCASPTPYCELGAFSQNYGQCVVCTSSHTGVCTLDAGLFCNTDIDQCQFDCRSDAGACFPGFCDGDGGQPICQPGCLDDTTCPSSASICLQGTCVACLFDDAGCTTGDICYPDNSCHLDCRGDGGSCVGQFGGGNYCDGDSGMCQVGCFNAGDCANGQRCITAGSGTSGTCNDCLTEADCAAFAGCNANGCGSCSKLSDCPSPLGCDTNNTHWCTCTSDTDCQNANPNAPNCIDAGFGNLCGCISSDSCPLGTVCDPRAAASAIFPQNGIFMANPPPPYVGYCVARCDTSGGLACATVAGLPVCDVDSGYCVGCTQDSDCPSTAGPHCVPFADAGYDAGIPYGGICGCSDTSQCNDGNTCDTFDFPTAPGVGQCAAACQRDAGYVYLVYDNCPNFFGGFCDTFNGICYQCLDDYECTFPTFIGPPSPYCIPAIGCVQCLDFSNCPADLPGCQASQYQCGFCDTVADCPPDAGFTYTCTAAFVGATARCIVACTADGGTSQCPSGQPICNADAGACVECLKSSDCGTGCCDRFTQTCQPHCILPP